MRAASLLLLLPQAQSYVAHFVEGIQMQDRATLMRLGEYKDALALISRYPWFGVGFAGSPDADLYVGVSNLYLLMAEIMGVLGRGRIPPGDRLRTLPTSSRAGGRWRPARTAAAAGRFDPRMEALLLGLLAAVTGALVGGIFDHYLFNLVYPHMSVLLWSYIGLGMAIVEQIRRDGQAPARAVDA